MSVSLHNEISNGLQKISKITFENKEKIANILEILLEKAINFFSDKLNSPEIHQCRKIYFKNIKEIMGVSFGIERNETEINIANWIFNLQSTTQSYILYFFILKEGLLHFIESNLSDVDESIINMITVLLFIEMRKIATLDNPALIAITSRMYPNEIGGKGLHFWDSLLILLISKDMKFDFVLEEFNKLKQNSKITQEEKAELYADWVKENTVKEEDVIAPIYLNPKLIKIVETLLENGIDNGTSSHVAKLLKVHQNTIRNQFRELINYSAAWISVINYETLKLYDYFIKIETKNKAIFEKICEYLSSIPYLKNYFQGNHEDTLILYSPQLVCPHVIAEQIRNKFSSYQKKGSIDDYCVQLIRNKVHYNTISDYPHKATLENFEKMFEGKIDRINKYIFHVQKKDFSMEFDDSQIPIDYNLLYFLSFVRGKYLLRGRYSGWVNELPPLFEKNDISISDVVAQNDFLNQIEIRARKRGLLDYSLFMKNFSRRGSDILIIELLINEDSNEERIESIIEKLRIFSFIGRINLYDRYILTLPGISEKHPVSDMIRKVIKNAGIKSKLYSIRLLKSRFVPLHELYDYDEQKWKYH
ncbi:MAG: hypothetical protein EAX90_06265 [Candidatus Heimdallarchaeota archaeon]|nr:hypothetical protein [Candidatus Heimdallarchaeota archaeon]